MEIHGSNFDSGSFVVIDGRIPVTTNKSNSLLEANLKGDITDNPGNKIVKVHTGAGGPSNDKTWTVTNPMRRSEGSWRREDDRAQGL